MTAFENKIPNVYFLRCPFGDCWTGITLIKGAANYLIDSGGNADCVDNYLLPALCGIGVSITDIDYLLCTHTHADHIGGHRRVRELHPSVKLVSSAESADKLRDPLKYNKLIRASFPEHSPTPSASLVGNEPELIIGDADILEGEMMYISTPGHDTDSGCWLHIPTKTLISGDSLQANGTDVQGIGLYMDLPAYRGSLKKLSDTDIENILTGHHFLPLGYEALGYPAVKQYLDTCMSLTETYGSFVREKHNEGMDAVSIAKALIKKVDGTEPNYMFLPLYSVTEHLKEILLNKNTTED